MQPSTPHYSGESLCCAGALKNRLLKTSAGSEWTSCLLDHVDGDGATDVHETHVTPDITVVVATRGEHDVEVFQHGRWHHAVYQVGAMGLTLAGELTRLRWRNRRPGYRFRTAHLYVPAQMIIDAAELFRRPGQRLSTELHSTLVANDRAAEAVVGSLLHAMENREPDIYAETALRWLSVELISRYRMTSGSNDDGRSPGRLSDRRLARAMEYLSANLTRPVSVADLASEAGISPFHLSRLFSEATGLSPHAFLARQRMEKGRRLLDTTDLPVAAVGVECGYQSPAAFSSAFSRHFGFSPRKVKDI